MKNLNGSCAEIIGVAAYEQCEKFVETLDKYQQFTDIRNVGAAVHSITFESRGGTAYADTSAAEKVD